MPQKSRKSSSSAAGTASDKTPRGAAGNACEKTPGGSAGKGVRTPLAGSGSNESYPGGDNKEEETIRRDALHKASIKYPAFISRDAFQGSLVDVEAKEKPTGAGTGATLWMSESAMFAHSFSPGIAVAVSVAVSVSNFSSDTFPLESLASLCSNHYNIEPGDAMIKEVGTYFTVALLWPSRKAASEDEPFQFQHLNKRGRPRSNNASSTVPRLHHPNIVPSLEARRQKNHRSIYHMSQDTTSSSMDRFPSGHDWLIDNSQIGDLSGVHHPSIYHINQDTIASSMDLPPSEHDWLIDNTQIGHFPGVHHPNNVPSLEAHRQNHHPSIYHINQDTIASSMDLPPSEDDWLIENTQIGHFPGVHHPHIVPSLEACKQKNHRSIDHMSQDTKTSSMDQPPSEQDWLIDNTQIGDFPGHRINQQG